MGTLRLELAKLNPMEMLSILGLYLDVYRKAVPIDGETNCILTLLRHLIPTNAWSPTTVKFAAEGVKESSAATKFVPILFKPLPSTCNNT